MIVKIGYVHRCLTTVNILLWEIVDASCQSNSFAVHRSGSFDILLSLCIICKLILTTNKTDRHDIAEIFVVFLIKTTFSPTLCIIPYVYHPSISPVIFDILLSLFIICKFILVMNNILFTEKWSTKGVIKIRKSKKNRPHNGKKERSTKGQRRTHNRYKDRITLSSNQSVNDSMK